MSSFLVISLFWGDFRAKVGQKTYLAAKKFKVGFSFAFIRRCAMFFVKKTTFASLSKIRTCAYARDYTQVWDFHTTAQHFLQT